MSYDDAPLTARLQLPDLIVRGQACTIRCPLYRDGALVEPTSGTVSVYDASGTAIVNAASATITGSIATYSIAGNVTAALAVEEGWRVEWSLTVDGVASTYRNDAALVRAALVPVITDIDVKRRLGSLTPGSSRSIVNVDDHQDYIDEAWGVIQRRLIEQGNRPNLIMSPSALRECHVFLTLALIFEDLATRLNQAHVERAAYYHAQYEAAWLRLRFVYDHDDDGKAEDPKSRRGGPSTIWLTSRGR